MKRYIKTSVVDKAEQNLNYWIDQGLDDVDIDDEIFDMGGDESTIDELRQRGRIDKDGHYVYANVNASINVNSDLPQFIEDNVGYIVDKVNDEDYNHELFGSAFRDECINQMKQLCREHGYSAKDIRDYAAHFVEAFYEYGEY